MSHPVVRCAIVCALLVAFIWPAIANRQPFFYPDSITYTREGDAVAARLLHHASAWSASPDAQSSTATVNVRARNVADAGKRGVLAGRSMFYGTFLFFGYLLSRFWLTALLQAACVLLATWLTLRAFGPARWTRFLLIVAGLVVCSTAPFTSSMLMPDIFAGITILAASVLLTAEHAPARGDCIVWLALLAAAAMFHDTCLALVLIFLLAGAIWLAFFHRSRLTRLWILVVAVIAGFVGHAIFTRVIAKSTGVPPLKSPFLMARLEADGPGARYLKATCPESGFAVCQFADRLPMPSDQFLFNAPEQGGVFWAVPMETRRALDKEQMRFALAVLRFDPVGTLKSVAGNALRQLVDFRLAEYVYPPGSLYHEGFTKNLPLPVLATMQKTPAYRGTFPWVALSVWIYVGVVLALGYILVRIMRASASGKDERSLVSCTVAVLLGILVNAALCGAVSGVYPRFESRVIWLVPLMALVMLVENPNRDRVS